MTMQQITQRKRALLARVLAPGYVATERDAAEAAELVNQYIDELERLERTITPAKVTNIDKIANDILNRWYP